MNMTGNEIAAIIHGTVLSILFARAISSAPADQGLAKSEAVGGVDGLPGCKVAPVDGFVESRLGERYGEEKDRR